MWLPAHWWGNWCSDRWEGFSTMKRLWIAAVGPEPSTTSTLAGLAVGHVLCGARSLALGSAEQYPHLTDRVAERETESSPSRPCSLETVPPVAPSPGPRPAPFLRSESSLAGSWKWSGIKKTRRCWLSRKKRRESRAVEGAPGSVSHLLAVCLREVWPLMLLS